MTDSTGTMAESTANPYLRDAVLTATAEQLQLMLYDGAIRFALQARDALESKDFEQSHDRLARAQHIIIEMINGLNYEVNAELCKRVASVYNFLYNKLIDANTSREVGPIDDAVKVLRFERETWRLLVEKVNKARDETGSVSVEAEKATPTTAECNQHAAVSFSAEA